MSEPTILYLDFSQLEVITITFTWFGLKWMVDVASDSLEQDLIKTLAADTLELSLLQDASLTKKIAGGAL